MKPIVTHSSLTMHEKNDRFAKFLKERYKENEVIMLNHHTDCTFFTENEHFVGDLYLIQPNHYKTYHLFAYGEHDKGYTRLSCSRIEYVSREDSDKLLRFFFKNTDKHLKVFANFSAFSRSFLNQISQHVKLVPDLETIIKQAEPVLERDEYVRVESKPRSSSVTLGTSIPYKLDYNRNFNSTATKDPLKDDYETRKSKRTNHITNDNSVALIAPDVDGLKTRKSHRTNYIGNDNRLAVSAPDVDGFETRKSHRTNYIGNDYRLAVSAPDADGFETRKSHRTNYFDNDNRVAVSAPDADGFETRKSTSTNSSGSNEPSIFERIKTTFFRSNSTKGELNVSPHISGGAFGKENKKREYSKDFDEDDRRDYYQNELVRDSVEKVGQGGQSHVVAAKIKDSGKQVAIKYSSFVSKLRGHCDKELNLLKELRHENIVAYYGVLYESIYFHNDPLGFVMEYMEGGSLHGVIYKSHATFYNGYNVLNWIRQATCGLIFLHKKKIIHRDIKPANLLLDREFKQVKICDLGISTQDPTSGTECGTIYYTPPEVFAEKRGEKFSTKCDIYSLGITLWEVCHRKPPYEKQVLLDLLIDIRDQNLRPTIDDEVCPREFADLIKIMWDKEVAKRPDAERVRDEIDRIANKYPKQF